MFKKIALLFLLCAFQIQAMEVGKACSDISLVDDALLKVLATSCEGKTLYECILHIAKLKQVSAHIKQLLTEQWIEHRLSACKINFRHKFSLWDFRYVAQFLTKGFPEGDMAKRAASDLWNRIYEDHSGREPFSCGQRYLLEKQRRGQFLNLRELDLLHGTDFASQQTSRLLSEMFRAANGQGQDIRPI